MAVERLKTVSTAMAVECFNNVAVELQSGCRKKSGCRKTGNLGSDPFRVVHAAFLIDPTDIIWNIGYKKGRYF